MTDRRRNLLIVAALLVALAVGAIVLRSAVWTLALAAPLALAAVVLLRGNRWRNGGLMAAAVALGALGVNAFAAWFAPAPAAMGAGVVQTTNPKEWMPPEPVLGYRLLPNLKVEVTETYNGELLYRVFYTTDALGMRATPAAPPGADTYLFMGDSFMLGDGLPDEETLPWQFARARDYKVRAVNFSAPGYGPNHLVRAFEAGLVDRYKNERVKAVVTWIIPSHLARVTGDGGWLGASPRYVLENGVPRHTGSFTEHRLFNPLAGLTYLAGNHLAFVKAIGERQRQQTQGDLFVALLVQLQALARERLGVPLIVIYSWPDAVATDRPGDASLVRLIERLREQGVPLLSVDKAVTGYPVADLLIPHDGHPTGLTTRLVAEELARRLIDRR